ncbi:hypothetical protein HPP92_025499 [Vanilla planifolia]|uniref:Uncharacterized protein n=1 Tax=Vanilla planifolia TaxID=51239 RepID=A0A835UAN7_VANPL|nr:hypothetical protein HPP92_025808 [Vanilla planifolia]KAG0454195.1 hypothetical protein HPP92_025499 [Vanilla planifolia]
MLLMSLAARTLAESSHGERARGCVTPPLLPVLVLLFHRRARAVCHPRMAIAASWVRGPLLLSISTSPKKDDLRSRFLSLTPFLSLRLPTLSFRCKPLSSISRRRLCSAKAAQSNFVKVIQTAWRVGRDSVEAGTNLVPDSIPRPIARISVSVAIIGLAFFLLNSFLSTAFFVLAVMGLVYFLFLAFNTDEGPRGGGGGGGGSEADPLSEDESLEEARRIMEKYK